MSSSQYSNVYIQLLSSSKYRNVCMQLMSTSAKCSCSFGSAHTVAMFVRMRVLSSFSSSCPAQNIAMFACSCRSAHSIAMYVCCCFPAYNIAMFACQYCPHHNIDCQQYNTVCMQLSII